MQPRHAPADPTRVRVAAARYTNLQRVLPLVQLAALPVYALIGHQGAGLRGGALVAFTAAAPVVVHAFFLGVGFVISYLNRDEGPGPRRRNRRDWLIAWFTELLVSLREFYWLMPFRESFQTPSPVPPRVALPILFIHGYGCNRGLWLPAAYWFAQRGYDVAAINLTPMAGPIDAYATTITEAIARLRDRTGVARVALVCHSMGGLAARAYLRDCVAAGVDPGVASVITLGTPHRGTHVAWLGLGENARQMRFGSDWLGGLDAIESGPSSEPLRIRRLITTIASLHDNIVSRQSSQRLAGPRAIMVRRHGHMSLATSPRVFRIVDRLLRRAARSDRRGAPPR